MSQDDSNTTAPLGSASASTSTERSGLTANVPLLVGLALLLVVGVIAFFVLSGEDDGAASDCVTEEVLLTTAPDTEDLVKKAVAAFEADENCIDVKVATATVKDVVDLLDNADAEMPELWIPDSPSWKGQLSAAGWTGTPIVDVIAQSPVGLASGPTADTPASWAAVLEGTQLAVSDPSADGASALALVAPYAEAKKTGRTPDQIKEATVQVANQVGVTGAVDSVDLSNVGATSTQLVPVTEKDYLTARRGNDQVSFVAPATGAPVLEYPIIKVSRGGGNLLGTGRDVPARVGRALAHWFSSNEGLAAVTAAEFRTPDGAELPGDIGLKAKKLGKVSDQITNDVLREWRVLTVPSSLLTVIDLSGSMKRPIGAVSRIQMTSSAASTALGVLSDDTRIGLWGFSKNRGENGQSWEEYTPMRNLGEDAGDGMNQRELLEKVSQEIVGKVRGGTGVMDATLAAYKAALEQWDPAYFNSVVIFTDGASDDTSSMGIDALVKNLEGLRDPSRPVKVIVIGISAEADTPELKRIADATGGKSFTVNSADDILGVLATSLLDR